MGNVGKIALVGGIFAAVFAGSQAFMAGSRQLSPKELHEELEKQVASLKPTLPQKVHPIVTWFDADVDDDTVIYKYQVDAPYSALSAKEEEMKQQLKGSWVGWAATAVLPRGAKLRAKIYDQNKNYVFCIDFN